MCNNRLTKCDWDASATGCDELVRSNPNTRLLDGESNADTHVYTKAMANEPTADYDGCKKQNDAYYHQPIQSPVDTASERECWTSKFQLHEYNFLYYLEVADCFTVWIDGGRDKAYATYAAAIAASFLDADNDGKCDDERLGARLKQNRAAVAIFMDEMSTFLSAYLGQLGDFTDPDIDPPIIYIRDFTNSNSQLPWENPTVEAVLQAILRYGLEPEWPDVFSRDIRVAGQTGLDSTLTLATDAARGGHLREVPPNPPGYGKRTLYRNYNVDCDYKCQTERLLVYSLIMVQGTFNDEHQCWNGPNKDEFPGWTNGYSCNSRAIEKQQTELATVLGLRDTWGGSVPSWLNAVANLKVKPKSTTCPAVTKNVGIADPVEGYHFQNCFEVMTNPQNMEPDNYPEAMYLNDATHYFPKYIRVLDGAFNIFAQAEVSDDKLQYVAAIVSSMLDRNEKNEVYDKLLRDQLKNNKAHIVICHDEQTADTNNDCHNYQAHYNIPYPSESYPSNAHLWDNEIHIRQAFELPYDWAHFKLIRAIMRYGVSTLDKPGVEDFNENFDIKAPMGLALSEAMKAARGNINHDDTNYPMEAWYKNTDPTCNQNYRCLVENYLAWGVLTRSKAVTKTTPCTTWPGLDAEWKMCTDEGGIWSREAQTFLAWFNHLWGVHEWFEGITREHAKYPDLDYGKNIKHFCSAPSDGMMGVQNVEDLAPEVALMTTSCWQSEIITADHPFSGLNGLRYIVVHDRFRVFAGSQVSDKALGHVASVAASMLDSDNSGDIDDPIVKDVLRDNEMNAFIPIFVNEDDTDYITYRDQGPFAVMDGPRFVIFEDEILDYSKTGQPRKDPTVDRLLRVMLREVLAFKWPEAFNWYDTNSLLGEAMKEARDLEHDIVLPWEGGSVKEYPETSTYRNWFKELECDNKIPCFMSDLFTNTIMMMHGLMNDVCNEPFIADVYLWSQNGGCTDHGTITRM